MNSLQGFMVWCRETKSRLKQLIIPENNRSYGPSLTPGRVPKFHVPESSDTVLITNPKELNLDDELKQNYGLPFHTYKVARNPKAANLFQLKDNQFEACKRSRKEDDERRSKAQSGSPNKMNNGDTESMVLPNPILPRVEEIPSTYFGHLDKPVTGSFFKRKSDGSSKHKKKTQSKVVDRWPLARFEDVVEDPLPKRDSCTRSPQYYRRRSSLPGLCSIETDDKTLSNDAACRPRVLERFSSVDTNSNMSDPEDQPVTSSNSSPVSRALKRGFAKPPAFLGELKFEFEYHFEKKSFAVRLIRGENIGGFKKADYNINIYVKLYLMPGKLQIQSSEEHKHTKDPQFDEEFHFTKLSLQDIQKMSLRMKVYNNLPILPNEYLGEINMALGKYDLSGKTRIWKNIESKVSVKEDLGHIFVSLNLNVEKQQVTVTIGRATGLIYLPITGAPNPYVSVEVSQEFGNIAKMRTDVKKKTTFPVFKESLTFDLASVTPENLELTCVVVTVRSNELIRSDTTLGEVRLGYDSTENSEMLHWQEAKLCPGRDIGKWHYLMESGDVFN